MSICQAENGFSLDELVKKVADSYEKKAFADILKMNLQLTQPPPILAQKVLNSAVWCHLALYFFKSCGILAMSGNFERKVLDLWQQEKSNLKLKMFIKKKKAAFITFAIK